MPNDSLTSASMQEPSRQRSDYFGDLLGRADERLHRAPIASGKCSVAPGFLRKWALGLKRMSATADGARANTLTSLVTLTLNARCCQAMSRIGKVGRSVSSDLIDHPYLAGYRLCMTSDTRAPHATISEDRSRLLFLDALLNAYVRGSVDMALRSFDSLYEKGSVRWRRGGGVEGIMEGGRATSLASALSSLAPSGRASRAFL
jgi:hypothetical protein